MSRADKPVANGPPPAVPVEEGYEQQLREVNEALLIALVRQDELAEQAMNAERALNEEERVRQRQLALTNSLRVSIAGELATGLAHELNQPLSSICNLIEACIQYVRAGTVDTAKFLELLSSAADESLRAAAIVDHLRGFVSKGVPQLEPVDLGDVLRGFPRLLVRQLEQAGIEFHMDVPSEALPVSVDRVQIEQVLVNLIHNAIDAIEDADGDSRRIELTARSVDGMAEVSVRDTGTGVGVAATERMFEPFYTTKALGLGMGLALSRSILEGHRGRIWMEKPKDGGPGAVVCFAVKLRDDT